MVLNCNHFHYCHNCNHCHHCHQDSWISRLRSAAGNHHIIIIIIVQRDAFRKNGNKWGKFLNGKPSRGKLDSFWAGVFLISGKFLGSIWEVSGQRCDVQFIAWSCDSIDFSALPSPENHFTTILFLPNIWCRIGEKSFYRIRKYTDYSTREMHVSLIREIGKCDLHIQDGSTIDNRQFCSKMFPI